MILYVGMDDTDNLESRGTGRLARAVASELSLKYPLMGVTRHQLFVDPRVPYTSHNSNAAISLDTNGSGADHSVTDHSVDLKELFEQVKAMMLADFVPGSDPGLCVASSETAHFFTEFGRRAQSEIVTQAEAHALAAAHGVSLEGLGGTQDGVIGALAAVGLAACGDDGRYILVGRSREVGGLQKIDTVLGTGVTAVLTLDGVPVQNGLILSDKLRPARRGGQPVLYVEWQEDYWRPVKLD